MARNLLNAFVTEVIANSSFTEIDRIYLANRVMSLVGEEAAKQETAATSLIDLKDDLLEVALAVGKICTTLAEQDILGAELMNLVTPAPSQLNQQFWKTYEQDPKRAIADFYELSKRNDYIKVKPFLKTLPIKHRLNMVIWRLQSIFLSQKKIPRKLQQLRKPRRATIQPASFVLKMKGIKGD